MTDFRSTIGSRLVLVLFVWFVLLFSGQSFYAKDYDRAGFDPVLRIGLDRYLGSGMIDTWGYSVHFLAFHSSEFLLKSIPTNPFVRLSKSIFVDLTIITFGMTFSHECFGHAFRGRELELDGVSCSIGLPAPYYLLFSDKGMGFTSFAGNLDSFQDQVITLGGIEANNHFADSILFDLLDGKRYHRNPLNTYFMNRNLLFFYLLFERGDQSTSDIESFLKVYNNHYQDEENRLDRSDLLLRSLLTFLDPIFFKAFLDNFEYIIDGTNTYSLPWSLPLPRFSYYLYPFGQAYVFDLLFPRYDFVEKLGIHVIEHDRIDSIRVYGQGEVTVLPDGYLSYEAVLGYGDDYLDDRATSGVGYLLGLGWRYRISGKWEGMVRAGYKSSMYFPAEIIDPGWLWSVQFNYRLE